MSAELPSDDSRRHDLDALRAIAMLLGIGLHAAIAFIPGPSGWAIKDTQTSGLFALLVAAIHGFRMPLFFLISGFFTMMLFRKRGLKSLIGHRFKRIFVPMVLGLFTIIPATWIVSAYVAVDAEAAPLATVARDEADIHLAAARGDVDRIKTLLSEGVDVDVRDKDGVTPLMLAALFGKSDSAELLLGRGADPAATNHKGEGVGAILHVGPGITKWIGELIGVLVDPDAVAQGRGRIATMLGDLGVSVQLADKSRPPLGAGRQIAAALMAFPLLGHLWFLWFLCWLVLGFAVCIVVGRRLRLPSPPRWLFVSAASYVWLIPLTMIPQAFMGRGELNFGPDTSIGLLPMPAVLVYYAIFFGFGAFYFHARDDAGRMGKRWAIALPVCLLVLFPIGMAVSGQSTGTGRWVSLLTQSAYAWLMSFGLMGLFRRFLSGESRAMRYLSDSSYWLYLAHLPLIILVESWVREYNVTPWLKFPAVCLVTSAILLASYQFFVRYTPIGTLLNGKRDRVGARKLTTETQGNTEEELSLKTL